MRSGRRLHVVASVLTSLLGAAAIAAPSEGTIDVTVYRSDKPFSTALPMDGAYGGLLSFVQRHPISWFFPALLCFILVVLALRLCKPPLSQRVWVSVSLVGVFAFSAILSLKEVQGWDELFIGAKHAHSMLVANKFSYNVSNMQEANTEFLPLFVTGLLAKIGFPILETMLALGLLGNLWLISTAYKLFSRLTSSSAAGLIYAAGAGLFPCVVITAMSGFFCCLFSAAVLSAIYILFFSDRPDARRRGLLLLAFLTLFRIEGVLIAFLIWLYLFVVSKAKSFANAEERSDAAKAALASGALLVAPFVGACLIRYAAFGHAIPAPAALKNAGGDPSFVATGVAYLNRALDSFELKDIALLAIPAAMAAGWRDERVRKLEAAWLILAAFSMPYVLNGGDWFPAYWARYFMPAILMSFFLWWGGWAALAGRFAAKSRFVQPALAALLVASPYALDRSFFDSSGWPSAFSVSQKMVGSAGYDWQWGRVNALAKYGLFLKETTAPTVRIGTPEEATMMWFADRDAVDVFGFATPEISYSKVDPMTPGNILHRKRNPITLVKYKPDIVALVELAYNETVQDFPNDQAILDHYREVYRAIGFTQRFVDIAYFRVGSFEYLKRLGYHLIFVGTPNAIYFYWVNDSILKDHIAAIGRLGCKEVGKLTLPYRVSPGVAEHFSSGEELLGAR